MPGSRSPSASGACLNAALLYRGLRKHGVYRPQPGWPLFLLKVAAVGRLHGDRALHHHGRVEHGGSPRDGRRSSRRVIGLVVLGAAAYGGCLLAFGFRPRDFSRRAAGWQRSSALRRKLRREDARHRPRAVLPADRAGRRTRRWMSGVTWTKSSAWRCACARACPRLWTLEERIVALNEFLFGELGYRGNTRDYYDPRNSYLNDVLDRRTGIPITLSVLYMELGRRVGLRGRRRVVSRAFPGAGAAARRRDRARSVRGRGAAVRGGAARPAEARDPGRGRRRRAGGRAAARPVPRAGDQAPDPDTPAAQPEGHLPRHRQARAACSRC